MIEEEMHESALFILNVKKYTVPRVQLIELCVTARVSTISLTCQSYVLLHTSVKKKKKKKKEGRSVLGDLHISHTGTR